MERGLIADGDSRDQLPIALDTIMREDAAA